MTARSRILLAGAGILFAIAVTGIAARYYYFHRFDPLIAKAAREHQLDPDLIWALIYEESLYDPRAVGEAGEKGLMQVSPGVLREWSSARGYANEREGVLNYFGRIAGKKPQDALFSPEVNMDVGSWYLRLLISKYETEPEKLVFALAAYNAGPTNADHWLKSVPESERRNRAKVIGRIEYPKTRDYVRNIIRRYESGK